MTFLRCVVPELSMIMCFHNFGDLDLRPIPVIVLNNAGIIPSYLHTILTFKKVTETFLILALPLLKVDTDAWPHWSSPDAITLHEMYTVKVQIRLQSRWKSRVDWSSRPGKTGTQSGAVRQVRNKQKHKSVRQHMIIRSTCVQVSSKTSTDLRLAKVIPVHITQPLQSAHRSASAHWLLVATGPHHLLGRALIGQLRGATRQGQTHQSRHGNPYMLII